MNETSSNGLRPSPNGSAKRNGSATAAAMISVEEYASRTDNPALWLTKYKFYIDVLRLSQAEALEWADADVTINTEARREFGLPPAKPLQQDAA